MSLPSPRPHPRAPKPRKTDATDISLGHPIRVLLVFIIVTWALIALLERWGITNPVSRMGVALIISLLLTPVSILLIDRCWKRGKEQI